MPEPTPKTNATRRFITKRDLLILGAVLLMVAVGLCLWAFSAPGGTALISVGTGEAATSTEISLARDGALTIDGANGYTTKLEVKDGRVRFVGSACPDHTCEGFGWLQNEGDWALCAPAEVMVRVTRGP